MNDAAITRAAVALEENLEPALTVYGEALAQHRHDYAAAVTGVTRCVCGWAPTRPMRSPRRAVGIHIAAAHKRAERTYDAAATAIIEQRGKAQRAAARTR